jgi:hypothetical protein
LAAAAVELAGVLDALVFFCSLTLLHSSFRAEVLFSEWVTDLIDGDGK